MIEPMRAPVRPRVFLAELGDAVPLDDLVLGESLPQITRRSPWVIEVLGGPGSGKTTALKHLAAVLPSERQVTLLDLPMPAAAIEAAESSPVVFTSLRTCSLYGALSCRLAEWGDDELVEYLLAASPHRCASVMARLREAPDRDLAEGIPEIYGIVLTGMAEVDSLQTVAEAVRQTLKQRIALAHLHSGAEQYSLATVTGRYSEAAACLQGLQRLRADAAALSLLRHRGVRLVLAGDRLVGLLETHGNCEWLRQRLPQALVEAVGKAASPAVVQTLLEQLAEGPESGHAMAASLLHATGIGWRPAPHQWTVLAGAYLRGAAWKAAHLPGAKLVEADLSHSDLAGANLDGAQATQANFRQSTLHGSSMVKLEATGADFDMADLTAVNGRGAVLRDAVLTAADLSDACLAKADLHGANLADARLAGADLTYTTLTAAIIRRADFTSADLRWACLNRLSLREACLAEAAFSGAHLKQCDLEGTELPGADFAEAHLQGALFTATRMPRASFTGARLQEAALADVDWEGVDLRSADMSGCTFHLGSSRSGLVNSPIACEGSRTGFYDDDYDLQTFRAPEEIRKANLCGADLRDAVVETADFYLVDLRGAKYTREQFQHFRRCGAILFDRS